MLKREPTLRLVDLHRGHADIENNTVDERPIHQMPIPTWPIRRIPVLHQHPANVLIHLAERLVDQPQPVAITPTNSSARANRRDVAVERHDAAIGPVEDCRRVSTSPERPVDEDLAVGWGKRLEHLGQQDRDMPRAVPISPIRTGT